jgi:hypothetical protein
MFTERILEMAENPVVLAEQKMTVPTERLIAALRKAEELKLSLVNLTYLGAPFIDPGRGDFDLLKPRILTAQKGSEMFRPRLSKKRTGLAGELATSSGINLTKLYGSISALRSNDTELGLGQTAWLRNPKEFDMTKFYLKAAGITEPTGASIADSYLPAYYEALGQAGIPVIKNPKGSTRSRKLAEANGVTIIDLPDEAVSIPGVAAPPDFRRSSYIDFSSVEDRSRRKLLELVGRGVN